MRIGRRTFGRILAGALFPKLLPAAGAGALNWEMLPAGSGGSERTYRADAEVLLLSIPVLRRKGVGDGSVVWRESAGDGDPGLRFLEFTGRSIPERAAGLNRFGFIRELSRAGRESIYFGLMTSSPEESAAEARKALRQAEGDVPYAAIEGHIAPGRIETTAAHFTAPARLCSADRKELLERARTALAGIGQKTAPGDTDQPFLHALAGLIARPAQREARYTYNGRVYRLRIEASPDAGMAQRLRESNLVGPAARVLKISGRLRPEAGGSESAFRLWIEEGSPRPLPLRIEYQPKSYLRLVFEAARSV